MTVLHSVDFFLRVGRLSRLNRDSLRWRFLSIIMIFTKL